MIICEVNKNHLNIRTRELLTAGSQNVNTVEFRFNEAWDGLAKTATFKTSKKTISVLLNTNTTAIPWEALADAGEILAVGVFGVSGETIVLPTVWGILGKVMDAAHLGDEEKEPTPDVYQKILDELNALERPTWDSVQNKPFSTLGGGLAVDENGVLSAEGGSGGSANAVQYVAQTLTDEQKTQARENIGAKAATEKSAYIISKTRSYGYIHTDGMDFDGVYAQIQSGKVVMLLVDDSSTYYGVIHPASGTGAGKEIVFYNIADISDSGGRNKGIEYFGYTWRKGDDSLTEWWGDIPRVKVDETLTESGSAADAKAVGDALQNYVPAENYEENLQEIAQAFDTKLDKNQGAGNAGKILGIGEDGNVVPQDKPSGDSVTVDSELSSTSENPVQNKIITAALAEKITAPTTAAVGQIIKVKSVDGTGKPTEWEAADLPSGGGKEEPTINNLLCETVFPANNVAAQEITCDVTCAQLAQYKELHFSIRGANNTSIPNLYLSVAGIKDAHLIRMIAAGFYGIVRRDFENSNLVRVWTGTSNPSLVPDSPTDSKTYLYDTFTVGMQPKILDWTKIFAAADKKLILKCSSTPTIDYTLKIYGVVAMT